MSPLRQFLLSKSDNIPGIRGIGGKIASRLLENGAHLEDLNTHTVGRIGHLIQQHWDELLLWRSLIQLRTDIPVQKPRTSPRPSTLPPAPEIVGMLGLWD
jgi:DNA polymerase I